MIKKLFALSNSLRLKGYKKESELIISLAEDVSAGNMPDFSWITQGKIMRDVQRQDPKWFDEFLDLNSFTILKNLGNATPVEYLGSGATGDAWRLSDGRVLKMFDSEAKVRNEFSEMRSSLEDYEEIEELQFSGKADPSQPKIYVFENLEQPERLIKSPVSSRFNRGSFSPAFAIMEGVNTIKDLQNKYIINNPDQMQAALEFDEEGELIGDITDMEGLIKREEVPNGLIDKYDQALIEGEYEEFLKEFIKYMNSSIYDCLMEVIRPALESWHDRVDGGEGATTTSVTDDPDNEDEYILDFNNPENVKILARIAKENLEYCINEFSSKSLSRFESILKLPPGWDFKLSIAMINNYKIGRTDIHGDNWGFRGDQPVFFDA